MRLTQRGGKKGIRDHHFLGAMMRRGARTKKRRDIPFRCSGRKRGRGGRSHFLRAEGKWEDHTTFLLRMEGSNSPFYAEVGRKGKGEESKRPLILSHTFSGDIKKKSSRSSWRE